MNKILFSILQHLKQLYINLFYPKYGRVFMFHKICANTDEYSINKNEFEKFIKNINNLYNIVTIEEFVKRKHKNDVVLTFDDAYESAFAEIKEFLLEKNIPFYIFVCNEYLDKDEFLTTNQLKELYTNDSCHIGSHYNKHIFVRNIDNKEFQSDIEESKIKLEEECPGVKINTFAFPYGSLYAVSREKIKIASNYYNYIFTTFNTNYYGEYVINSKGEKSYIIPRININYKNYNKIK